MISRRVRSFASCPSFERLSGSFRWNSSVRIRSLRHRRFSRVAAPVAPEARHPPLNSTVGCAHYDRYVRPSPSNSITPSGLSCFALSSPGSAHTARGVVVSTCIVRHLRFGGSSTVIPPSGDGLDYEIRFCVRWRSARDLFLGGVDGCLWLCPLRWRCMTPYGGGEPK